MFGQAVVRDQKPMDNRGLGAMSPKRAYPSRMVSNAQRSVFFWLTRERLLRLLNAGAYADKEHDVLELDTAPLGIAYREAITLSQSTVVALSRFRAHAGAQPSLSIDDYPYATRRAKKPRGRACCRAFSPRWSS
jgi:hypothetical protein